MQDVNASKGVLVSRKGFSRTAIQKARRLGISLLRADQLDVLRDLQSDVPIFVRRLEPNKFSFNGMVNFKQDTTVSKEAMLSLNDSDLRKVFRDELLADKETVNRTEGQYEWIPKTLAPPFFFRDETGEPHTFTTFALNYRLRETHLFGYMSDLKQALFIRDGIEKSNTVLLPAESILNDQSGRFAPFETREELPVEPQLSFSVPAIPEMRESDVTFQLIHQPT